MRLLIISNSYPTELNPVPGIFVKEQVESLRKEAPSFKIEVYYNLSFKWLKSPTAKKGLLWNLLKYLIFNIFFLPHLFKKYDLIHAHQCFYPGFLALIHHWLRGTHYVITSHGGDIDSVAKMSKIIFNLERLIFRHAQKIIAVSNLYQQKIENNFGVTPRKIETISCGVDFTIFKTRVSGDSVSLKNKLGLDSSKKTLLFVGNLIERKNGFLFVKCLERLEKQAIQGCIVGDGEQEKALKAYCQEKEIDIFFAGRQAKEVLALYMQVADIFIFPSKREPFGLVGVEALACGTPIIASKVGGITDYLLDGINGLFFKQDSLDDLVDKINILLNDQKLYDQIVHNTVSSIEQYDLKQVAQRIKGIYLCQNP